MTNPNYFNHPLYDLASYKFQNTQITTNNNEAIDGQFVTFEVAQGAITINYPNKKYCFLPHKYSKTFWDFRNQLKDGIFNEFPKQVTEYEEKEIIKIIINPIFPH